MSEQTWQGLARLLEAALPEARLDAAATGEQLRAMLESAARRWPAIALAPEKFVRHLAPFVAADPTATLARLHGDDLYLACACLDGNAAATAIFDAEYLGRLQLPQLRGASDLADEIRQRLREKALAGGKARLAGYSGKGPLAGWLRVAATRLALDLANDARRRARVEAVPDEAAPAASPEQQLMGARYRQPIEAAFGRGFAALDAESRRLLRLHYIDGRSLTDVAAELGVDRSTASRRVSAARDTLLAWVKRELGQELQLTPASVDTLVNALKSQLVITLRALRD